jgi:hypothetical protein
MQRAEKSNGLGGGPVDVLPLFLYRRFEVDSSGEAGHSFGGDLDGTAAPWIANPARFPLRHAERAETGERHPVTANQARADPFQEGLQCGGRLRASEPRFHCNFHDQIFFVHEALTDACDFYQSRGPVSMR